MIPAFDKFFFPILKHIEDGQEYSLTRLRDYCATYFNLTPEDIAEKIKSGHSRLYDRVQWTMAYFYQAEIVDRIRRGLYKINDAGKALLASGITDLSVSELKQRYPQFRKFTERSSKQSTNTDTPQQSQLVLPIIENQKTPIEIMEEQFQIINEELAAELLQQVKSQTAQFFENLVVELLVKMGYGGDFEGNAFVTQRSHDEGIDGIIKEDKLGLDKIYVQAKRWNDGAVGRREIQSFVGALSGQGASKGVFITTSTFTKDASEFRPQNNIKIVLIDGTALANYMIEYNIGVSVKSTYEIKRIDTDYFNE